MCVLYIIALTFDIIAIIMAFLEIIFRGNLQSIRLIILGTLSLMLLFFCTLLEMT